MTWGQRAWSNRDWHSWRQGSSWAASRSHSQERSRSRDPSQQRDNSKLETRNSEIEQRLADLKAQHPEPVPQEFPVRRSLDAALQVVDDKRRNALRLRAALAFRETLSDEQPALVEAIEKEIKEYRAYARGGADAKTAREDILRSLAESQVKLQRAEAHLATALTRRDTAEAEVRRQEKELEEFKAPPPPLPQALSPDFTPVAMMLTQLRASSQQASPGRFIVDGSILDGIALQIQHMASPVKNQCGMSSPATSLMPPATPSETASEAAVDSAMESEAFSDDTPSDSELRRFYAKFIRTPRTERHKLLVGSRSGKRPIASHHKKVVKGADLPTVIESPARRTPTRTPGRASSAPPPHLDDLDLPDMPDDF